MEKITVFTLHHLGEVTLRDLKLRREALDKFNLPVDVLEGKLQYSRMSIPLVQFTNCFFLGYLGELTLTIPWNNLRGKPVLINIKDAYVLAVPRNESTVRIEMFFYAENTSLYELM